MTFQGILAETGLVKRMGRALVVTDGERLRALAGVASAVSEHAEGPAPARDGARA